MPTIITIADQCRYVEQELAMYRSAYPAMVAKGQITQERASWRIECCERVLASLRSMLPPAPGSRTLICHFADQAALDEFVKQVADAGGKSVTT